MFKNRTTQRLLREQWPLLSLIALMFAIFAFQIALGSQSYRGLMTIPAEVVKSWNLLLEGELGLRQVQTFATLFTSAFLHGNIQHVFFNMIFLWIFGALLVELLGQRWMLITFAVTAISGSIFHTALNADELIPMLGASGAVMGFMGAYLGMAIRWQLPDPHVWPMSRPIPPANLAALAVIGVILDVMGIIDQNQGAIAYGAHIGGFLGGLFLTSFVVRQPKADLAAS